MGAAIYNKIGTNEPLKALFNSGHTSWNNWKLQEELTAIYNDLKNKKDAVCKIKNLNNQKAAATPYSDEFKKLDAQLQEVTAAAKIDTVIPNPQLYEACKQEADKLYKEKMNKRAVLFSMVPADEYGDPNRPDLVEARSRLCIDIVDLDIRSSKLYERADYVKKYGRLPNDVPAPDDEHAFEDLPDHLVKQTLDNERKAYNKLKNKEQTAERVLLMQKHARHIKLLEAKWHLLKPQK